jgi:trehalose-phosphatase
MNGLPPLWTNSEEAPAWWRQLKSESRSVLLLDYDGTLAPFQVDRFAAMAYPGVEDRLAALAESPKVRLALISGRSARELRGLLRPGTRVEIWGSHGWEKLRADGGYHLFPMDAAQQAMLHEVEGEMALRGFTSTLEVKPSSLAIHWRNREPEAQEQIRAALQSIYRRLEQPDKMQVMLFDGGLELRAKGRTKGDAVKQIRQEEPGAPVAYLGDDLTDEDAFAAVGDRGLSFLVRGEARASYARYWLRPPEELLEFLDGWLASAKDSR